ncbi:hypothetical protein, partial [Pararhizobium sp.]|uniref:hypothetical protein n=1 Tax=Pararhizobium sp. TaxID=1977563 RepID=UPI0027228952
VATVATMAERMNLRMMVSPDLLEAVIGSDDQTIARAGPARCSRWNRVPIGAVGLLVLLLPQDSPT